MKLWRGTLSVRRINGVNVYRYVSFLITLMVPLYAYSGVAVVDGVLDSSVSETHYTESVDRTQYRERAAVNVNVEQRVARDFPLSGKASINNDYHLAMGDKIQIHVFGEDGLSMEMRLDESGVINYPFLGKILVKGLTVESLQNTITEGLKQGYLQSPHVNVSIVEHRQFFINGEVGTPGGYAYVPGLTIRKAIALAGGFTKVANKERFLVTYDESDKNKVRSIGINAPIRPDDSITVLKSVFFIDGEINNVGSFPFRSGLTLREAISLAGGLTERASASRIVIVSKDGKSRIVGESGMATKIHPSDSISIKQSFF